MAKESVQQKLSRVRAPRVHIRYDVEIGDAIEVKELPFVMGVLGDFSGQSQNALGRLAERKFVEVNPDNFNDVIKKMSPRVAFSVPNRLNQDTGELKVDLTFNSLSDFDPEQVVKQVEPLKELLELRTKLSDLRGSLQGNAKLDERLNEIMSNTEKRQQLSRELGIGSDKGDDHA
jgi:type VI secretion system protein ImpB